MYKLLNGSIFQFIVHIFHLFVYLFICIFVGFVNSAVQLAAAAAGPGLPALAPYLLLPCLRFSTPPASNLPRTI